MFTKSRWLLALSICLCVAPVQAGLIFSNLGPGDAYVTGSGWTIGVDPGGPPAYTQGEAFTPGANATLAELELAVSRVSGANEMDVWLMSDSAGLPGTIIESFHFSNAMGSFGNANPLLSAVSVVQPVLAAGTQYWLIANAPEASTWAVWNNNSIVDLGPHATNVGAGWTASTGTRGAFRISSVNTAVPEPGSLYLLLPGLALLAAGLLRRLR